MMELLLGGLLVLSVVWLVVKTRQNKAAAKSQSTPTTSDQGKYHAVAIKYSENACDAAKAMTGRRFLANAAPRLPLPECNLLECRCHFAHYDDRRAKSDRRSPFARTTASDGTGSYDKERRERTDRRKESESDDYEW